MLQFCATRERERSAEAMLKHDAVVTRLNEALQSAKQELLMVRPLVSERYRNPYISGPAATLTASHRTLPHVNESLKKPDTQLRPQKASASEFEHLA